MSKQLSFLRSDLICLELLHLATYVSCFQGACDPKVRAVFAFKVTLKGFGSSALYVAIADNHKAIVQHLDNKLICILDEKINTILFSVC